MPTISETLETARRYHQAGAWQQAEQLYRQVLQYAPGHADALHLLGALAYQGGNCAVALQYVRAALASAPSDSRYYCTLGLIHHALGQVDDAVENFQHGVRLGPTVAESHYNLANALKLQGNIEAAIASYREALRLNPNLVQAHNNLGNLLLERNDARQAVIHYQEAIRISPGYIRAIHSLGNAYKSLGMLDEAAASYQQALRLKPDFGEAHNNLGNVFQEQKKFEQALACYREALRWNANSALVHMNLGITYRALGKREEAIDHFRSAVEAQPQLAKGHLHLGVLLQEKGSLDEAVAVFRRILDIWAETADPRRPTSQLPLAVEVAVEAYVNLANTFRLQRKWADAKDCYQRAIKLDPRFAEAHYNFGGMFAEQLEFENAANGYREAIQLKPSFASAHAALGAVLNDMGFTDEAIASLEEALRLEPSDRLRILRATRMPVIYQSHADLEKWRDRLIRSIHELRERSVVLDLTDEPVSSMFHLAYQGQNDLAIHREAALLYRAPVEAERPSAAAIPSSGKKIRVGLISSYFSVHTIGLLNRGTVEQLNRDDFEVTVLSVDHHDNAIADFFKHHADRYLEVPRHLTAARKLIAEQRLDVLFYTDIGMDQVTSTLAFSRLAPVQCTTWGHPVTSGIDTIDYFISSEALDCDGAEHHYTEKLIRLKNLAVYYFRPAPPQPLKDRSHFGFSPDDHLYACPQSLFKFHPDFDVLLGRILRDDPLGRLILLRGAHTQWDQLLLKRFKTTLPDVIDRVTVLPSMSRPDFLNLMAVSDVLLDPLHFGGGNSSYEGFAVGTPIVTLPSKFLRGRITFAQYKQMNVLDCVAGSPEDYVKIALRLGTDRDYRDSMRRKILGACGVLFEDKEGMRQLEEFFRQAVDHSRE